ncbi:MAG: putative toxin-antitoxin system toxin component, PIN family [Propionibacteriaceae bacterium]|nr:putative toxin-antitoxin system toxin component, PIN family [Propionibacteriaceae bacterium]
MTDDDAKGGEHRVVLDTNVLVSALLAPIGNPNTILQAILDGSVTIMYSATMMAEYRSVLIRPRFGFDARDVADLLTFIEAFGDSVDPDPSDDPLPDETDRPFYDITRQYGTILVTGNTKHFPGLVSLLTPAEYVEAQLIRN